MVVDCAAVLKILAKLCALAGVLEVARSDSIGTIRESAGACSGCLYPAILGLPHRVLHLLNNVV